MKHINGANELACELSFCTYVPTHARWQTQLRRDPRHAYLRMNWRRSVEPVEFVRRPRRDPALYKVDRPMDHVFIRRTSSWYVSIHRAIEISSQHRPIYFWSRDSWCDICHVKRVSSAIEKVGFFTHIERVLGVKCESLERSDFEYLKRDQSCTRIRSTANTARSARCWIVCWTRRGRPSEDQRASQALVATTAQRAIMDLSAAVTPWHIVIEVIFRGAGSDLLVRRDSLLKSNIYAMLMLKLSIYLLDTEFCFCLIGNSIYTSHCSISSWMSKQPRGKEAHLISFTALCSSNMWRFVSRFTPRFEPTILLKKNQSQER